MNEFIKEALNEGYEYDLVMSVAKTSEASTYDEFEDELYEASKKLAETMRKKDERKQHMQEVTKQKVKKLKSIRNLDAHITSLIHEVYRTKAVSPSALVSRVSDQITPAQQEIYEHPAYFVACNISAPVVEDAVRQIHSELEQLLDARDYVRKCYMARPGSEEGKTDAEILDAMLEMTSIDTRLDNTPRIYWALELAETLSSEKFFTKKTKLVVEAEDEDEFDEEDFELNLEPKAPEPEEATEPEVYEESEEALQPEVYEESEEVLQPEVYEESEESVVLETYEEEFTPELCDAEEDDQPKKKKPRKKPVEAIGYAAGKVVSGKYAAKKSLSEGFKDGMGDYAEDFAGDVAKRKEKAKQKKDLEYYEPEVEDEEPELPRLKPSEVEVIDDGRKPFIQKSSDATLMHSSEHDSNRNVYVHNSNNYKNPYVTKDGNFAPTLSPSIIAVGVHVIFFLVCMLVRPAVAFMTSIGSVLAVVGWLGKEGHAVNKLSNVKPITLLVAGYALMFLGLYIVL